MSWPTVDVEKVRREPICIVGAGPAGLITAHVLLKDGFQNVQVICRDSTIGGVWARGRVYPDMHLNNVYGEMRFSSLAMESTPDGEGSTPDNRLKGIDACRYFERYHEKFLTPQGKSVVRFNTEVLQIRRDDGGKGWRVDVRETDPNGHKETEETLRFSKIVLCTGGTSSPKVPAGLSASDATKVGFRGPVLHSSESWTGMESIVASSKASPGKPVVVVGGGKSAQDMSAYLANEGIPVTVVCSKLDMFISSRAPLPGNIRQSRLMTVLGPRMDLDTRLEKSLHNTWAGSKIVHRFWKYLQDETYATYDIPADSPLRDTHSLFWDTRYGDQGVRRENSFPALAAHGKINLKTRVHVSRFHEGGVELDTGEKLEAAAIILSTGYRSSWDAIFDKVLASDVGLTHVVNPEELKEFSWDYKSLHDPPEGLSTLPSGTSIIAPGLYKGLVPAKSIQRRDIAVTGAIGTANIGYVYEVSAHWISSYFLGENMRLPGGPEEAIRNTVRNLAWMKTRYPRSTVWTNPSYVSTFPQLSWIQAMDDLLDDIFLNSTLRRGEVKRYGGNRDADSEYELSAQIEAPPQLPPRRHSPRRHPNLMLFLLLLLNVASLCFAEEFFDEKLTVTPLKDGKVAATLAFTTVLKNASPRSPQKLHQDDDSQQYTLFPLALGQIIREYGVTEMHLTLNAGKWNYDAWGQPVEPGVGTGAELWAWIGDGALESVDVRWKGLRNALAGLFCSSLGQLDDLRTTSPVDVFRPEGSLPSSDIQQLRHASHPSENVCTENLTPFIKLLPCKSSAGLASLLNPHKLFDANWHGMGVHALWNEDEGVEVRLSFQAVSDPLRSPLATKQDWSFSTLFDRTVERSCLAARSSVVEVSLPRNSPYSISPEPTAAEEAQARYDVQAMAKPVDVSMKWLHEFQRLNAQQDESPATPLSIQRTLKEWNQSRGELSVAITNHEAYPVQAIYLETMPWIVQFYLHTLTATVDGEAQPSAISNLSYIPAVPHSRPTTFHVLLAIPAKSTLRLNMDVTKAFLRYTEHPPDAQRGWDLPPAIIYPLGLDSQPSRMYTPTLLVDLATPDFSMPYNVIIFTCTLVAFIFGNIFNFLTRKFVVVSLRDLPKERND